VALRPIGPRINALAVFAQHKTSMVNMMAQIGLSAGPGLSMDGWGVLSLVLEVSGPKRLDTSFTSGIMV
jgi:hypothetical protein